MKNRILLWSITSALAGFLFGFDTVVIAGAEQTIQNLWHLDAAIHGVAIASALYGTVVGSLLGAWLADRFGRRATLIFIGALYLIGAIGSAVANGVDTFIAARLLGGVGIGISTVAAPLYIAEIAPTRYRGRLTALFQFNIVFGILIAFLSDALLSGVGEHAWRWMLGVAAIPALIYTLMCFALPESPRWLLGKGHNIAAGLKVLRLVETETSEADIQAQAEVIRAASLERTSVAPFWSRDLRIPIALAFLIAFFNQLSGINAILYFAPRIFELTGLAAHAALLQSVGIGITNLIFTLAGIWLIDRLGRRTLLFIGSFGYIASLGAVAWAFFTHHYGIVPVCIFAFIGAHAIGQGAVIWVYISEVFPNDHRAQGQSLGSCTHWVFAALLTSFFPRMVTQFAPGWVFAFFAGMMVLQLIWVKFMVIETKGVPLEEIQHKLQSRYGN
jgi:MFS transporter, SP family, arabinose:H+ symporter